MFENEKREDLMDEADDLVIDEMSALEDGPESDDLTSDELESDGQEDKKFVPSDSDKAYLSEISRYPLLTPEEEQKLSRLARKGDKDAREKMIVSNLRLVAKLARRYLNNGVSYLDLIQEGNEGLMTAVEKFDPEKGFRFSTYATWWIRQSMRRAVENNGRIVRLPVHMQGKLNAVRKARAALSQELLREPSLREISERTGFSMAQISEYLRFGLDMKSMNESIGEDGDETFECLIPDESVKPFEMDMEREELRSLLDEIFRDKLSEKEAWVLRERFGLSSGEPRTLEDLGKQCGVTRERIRQIEMRAIRVLRQPSTAKVLKEYLA